MSFAVSRIARGAQYRRLALAGGFVLAGFLVAVGAGAQAPQEQNSPGNVSDRPTATVPAPASPGSTGSGKLETTSAPAIEKALRDRIAELETRVQQLTDALTAMVRKLQDTAGVSDVDQLLAQRQALIDRINGLEAQVAQLTMAITSIVKQIQDAGFRDIDQLLADRQRLVNRAEKAGVPEKQPESAGSAAANASSQAEAASGGSRIPFFVLGVMLGIVITALIKWKAIGRTKDPKSATAGLRDTLERGRSELDQLAHASRGEIVDLERSTAVLDHRLADLDAKAEQT